LAINWFRGGKKQQEPQEHTIDDLFILERYDEAGERLRARLKDAPNDLHSHLKLAEVYSQLRQFEKAVDEFVFVAEEYAQDGFHDKGIALLAKAMKLAPLDPSLRFKAEKLQRAKSLEQVRDVVLEGVQQAQGGTVALELRRLWPQIAGSVVAQKLTGESLRKLIMAMELLRFETGAPVAREGSPDAFLLLLVQGVVEASAGAGGKAVLVRGFSSGDVVGEGTLLERAPWPADYRAAEPVTALKLAREGLEACLLGNPDPRGFLETLREQHNDRDVAATVRRLRSDS
jgi:hypothetical protein